MTNSPYAHASSNVAVAEIYIACPNCKRKTKVYHLNWDACMCQRCDTILHNPSCSSNWLGESE